MQQSCGGLINEIVYIQITTQMKSGIESLINLAFTIAIYSLLPRRPPEPCYPR